eukprot:433844-Amphidinium_carterae.1
MLHMSCRTGLLTQNHGGNLERSANNDRSSCANPGIHMQDRARPSGDRAQLINYDASAFAALAAKQLR